MRILISKAFLMGAQCSEISCSLGSLFIKELEDELACFVISKVNFEEHVFEGHDIQIQLCQYRLVRQFNENRFNLFFTSIMSHTIIPSNGVISLESHSKQVKLLNDYIQSLEKRLGDSGESDSTRIIKLSDEANRLNDENIQLKNQISQMKYSIYKHQEALRHHPQEIANLKQLLDIQTNEKNTLAFEYQHIRDHLANCERHLEAMDREINQRTELFEAQKAKFSDLIENLTKKAQQSHIKCQQLENELAEQKKNEVIKIKNLESLNAQSLQIKNNDLTKLLKELEEIKLKLSQEMASSSKLISQHSHYKSDKTKQNQEMVKRTENLLEEIIAKQKQLDQVKRQFDCLVMVNEQGVTKIASLSEELSNVTISRDGAMAKVKELEVTIDSQMADSFYKKMFYEGTIQQKEEIIFNLNKANKQLQNALESLRKEHKDANDRIQRGKSNYSNNQKQYEEKIKQISEQKTHTINELSAVKQSLSNITNKYNIYQKTKDSEIELLSEQIREFTKDKCLLKEQLDHNVKEYADFKNNKEKQVANLTSKIKELIQEQTQLKQKSGNNTKDYNGYKKKKEAQIDGLNIKIKQMANEHSALQETIERLKQEYFQFQKKQEFQVNDLNSRLKDLQKQNTSLKENLESTTKDYYAFQKKTNAQIESQNQRVKEANRKIDKKDIKIQQLMKEVKQIEKLSEHNRINMGSSQQQQLNRLKFFYVQQNNELKSNFNEQRHKKEQLIEEKQNLLNQVETLQIQVKSLRDNIKMKQKSSLEIQRGLEKERDQLLNEVKTLNISSVLASQSKSSKDEEISTLNKAIINFQSFNIEQKKNIDNLTKLLARKQEQLQSLETSNAMLRKQVITSISNEQSSRKEVIETRSKKSSMIGQNKRSQIMSNSHKSTILLHANLRQKGGLFSQSIVQHPPESRSLLDTSRERCNTIHHHAERVSFSGNTITPEKESSNANSSKEEFTS